MLSGYGKRPKYPDTYERVRALTGLYPSFLGRFDEASGAVVDRTYAASLTRSAAAAGFKGAGSTAAAAGDCTLNWTIDTQTSDRVLGLDTLNSGDASNDQSYGLYLQSPAAWIARVDGTTVHTGTSVAGDVISLHRDIATGAVTVLVSGVVKHTFAALTADPLYANARIYGASIVMRDIRFTIGDVLTPITWTNVNAEITANGAANNLVATGTPTYGDIAGGRKGILYDVASDYHQGSVPGAGSALWWVSTTAADLVANSFLSYVYSGSNAAIVYNGGGTILLSRNDGAGHTQGLNPTIVLTADDGAYFIGVQEDYTGPTLRILVARAGKAYKANGSIAGYTAMPVARSARFGGNAAGVRIQHAGVCYGTQAEGATALDLLAARLGYL